MTSPQEWQRASKAHMAYGTEKPEWMQFALKAMNKWGAGEFTLTHIVALACEEAHRLGVSGQAVQWTPPDPVAPGGLYDFASHLKKSTVRPIAPPPPESKVMRRTRPGAPAPEPEEEFDLYADAPDERPPAPVMRRSRPAPPPELTPLQRALQAALTPPAPAPSKIVRRTR